MARRYGDINRGAQLADAQRARRAYQDRNQEQRNAARRNRVGRRATSPTEFILIKPFGQDLTAPNDAYRCRTNQRNRNIMRASVGAHATDVGGDSTYLVSGNFNPAVIKLFTKTGTRTDARSAITNVEYTQTLGDSHSHPFGRAATADREYTAYNAIATALRNASAANRVTYTPEKFSEER